MWTIKEKTKKVLIAALAAISVFVSVPAFAATIVSNTPSITNYTAGASYHMSSTAFSLGYYYIRFYTDVAGTTMDCNIQDNTNAVLGTAHFTSTNGYELSTLHVTTAGNAVYISCAGLGPHVASGPGGYSNDLIFEITDTEPLPVYNVGPTTTVYSPPAGTVIPSADLATALEGRAASDVVGTTGLTFDWLLFKDGILAGFKLNKDANLVYSASGFGADREVFLGLPASDGLYVLKARSCLGAACGVYGQTSFVVSDSATSSAPSAALTSSSGPFPSFTCSPSVSDLICAGYLFGTWLPDVIKWLVVPPSIGSFDPSSFFDLFKTRWPFAYFFGPITSWQTGFNGGASCPLPSFLGGTVMFGLTAPTFDLCPILDDAGDAIEANAFGRTTLQWVIYLSAVYAAWEVLIHTIHRKKT